MSRILIAEDDDLMADVLQFAFMEAGHGVGVLDDGAQALKAIRAKRPDLVILDCDLPGLHGFSILNAMRMDSVLWSIPVVFLTGNRARRDEDIALQWGAQGYLRKPVDPFYVVARAEEELSRPRFDTSMTHSMRSLRSVC